MRRFIDRFLRDDSGATAIEYGLICGLIFLVIIGAVGVFAGRMDAMYAYINTTIGGAVQGG
jgi:pilus assembly protein Flp/PilA